MVSNQLIRNRSFSRSSRSLPFVEFSSEFEWRGSRPALGIDTNFQKVVRDSVDPDLRLLGATEQENPNSCDQEDYQNETSSCDFSPGILYRIFEGLHSSSLLFRDFLWFLRCMIIETLADEWDR